MNPELQRTREQIQDEVTKVWSCAVMGNYTHLVEYIETVLILAKHAKEIVEREKR